MKFCEDYYGNYENKRISISNECGRQDIECGRFKPIG